MSCVNCGADLRPGARFCNQCGARQPEGDTPQGLSAASPVVQQAAEVGEGADAGAEKLKRPPRMPRATVATLGGEADEARVREALGEPAPGGPPEEPSAEAGSHAGHAGVATGTGEDAGSADAAAQGGSTPSPREETDWEGEDTLEQASLSGTGTGAALPPLETLAKARPEGDDRTASRWDPEGLSWPLPLNIIKGGRYRVEAVVHTSDDQAAGENVYRVRDLQGYERCWSCGMEYDAANAGNTFCQQCGADMLGRPYLMYERRLDESDLAASTPSGELTGTDSERRFVEGRRVYRVAAEEAAASPFPRGALLAAGIGADVGATRPGEVSEDSQAVLMLTLGADSHMLPVALAVVADGLGGHSSGQEASQLVSRSLVAHVASKLVLPVAQSGAPPEGEDERFTTLLGEGAKAANAALCRLNKERGEDMGSTLVAVLVVGDTAYVANAGDSRAYVFDHGDLRRITTDHSLVEQLIAGGIIPAEERYIHPQRNQIFKSLGDELDLQPDTFVERLAPGARLVLCSDGLWEMVRDDEMARVLAAHADPQTACDELVRRANVNGGEDNISVIVLDARA